MRGDVVCRGCWRLGNNCGGCSRCLETAPAEVARLRQAIRTHRDQRGDDRCWLDDEALYAALPEGYRPPARDTLAELERCRQYVTSRHHPGTAYVSPQRRIEQLETEVAALRELTKGE